MSKWSGMNQEKSCNTRRTNISSFEPSLSEQVRARFARGFLTSLVVSKRHPWKAKEIIDVKSHTRHTKAIRKSFQVLGPATRWSGGRTPPLPPPRKKKAHVNVDIKIITMLDTYQQRTARLYLVRAYFLLLAFFLNTMTRFLVSACFFL